MASILVIDDEPPMRSLVRRVLERAGHEVIEAENGAAGIAQYRQRRPDLVITDVLMPGMDGFQVLRDIRHLDPGARVIVLSAGHRLQANLLASAIKIGASATIEKPFRAEEFLKVIGAALSQARSSP